MPNRPVERLYSPSRLAALVALLGEDAVPADAVLEGTGLDAAALGDPACLTGIEQYLVACANARRLSADAALAFRIGARLRLSDDGMYGLLLLSCESMGDAFRRAVDYRLLATPMMAIGAVDNGVDAAWVFPDEARDLPADLRTFVVALQFAQQAALVQDILGAPCRPSLACFAHAAPAHQALYREHLGCECLFGWHRSELRYPSEILARRPRLANARTAAMLQSACDGLLADIEASLGVAGKVDRTLRRMRDPGTGMKAVASALQMNDRTLRRRLADEGTSFTTISHRVRYSVATEQLKGSDASIERIAGIAGFSDPSNFRRAFIRWTNMTPAQFRRQQHR